MSDQSQSQPQPQPQSQGGKKAPSNANANASPLPESYAMAHLEDLDAPALRQNLSLAMHNLTRMHERFAQSNRSVEDLSRDLAKTRKALKTSRATHEKLLSTTQSEHASAQRMVEEKLEQATVHIQALTDSAADRNDRSQATSADAQQRIDQQGRELRELAAQNEGLRAELSQLHEQHAADAADLEGLKRERSMNEQQRSALEKEQKAVARASKELEMLRQQGKSRVDATVEKSRSLEDELKKAKALQSASAREARRRYVEG